MDGTTDTPVMESGPQDAVSAFEGLLDKSMGEQAPNPEPKRVEPTADAADTVDEADATEDPPPEKTYKVKVDGQDLDVPESELLKGYSRQQDYTKKTMELAAQRQQVEQVANQVQAERGQYQAQLNQLAAALGQSLQDQSQIDWNKLLENDPVEYLRQQHLVQTRQAALSQARQEQERIAHQTQAQAATSRQQEIAREQEQLIAILPDWKDEAKATTEKAALAKHLVERGYTPEQINQLTDHKTVVMAREAMLYRQMVAKARETIKTVEKLPPRMEKPGVSRSPTDGRTQLMQSLKKSGSVDAAAALFEKMF